MKTTTDKRQFLSSARQGYGIYITEKYIKRTEEDGTVVARDFSAQGSHSRAHLSRRSEVITIVPEFVIFYVLVQEICCF